MILFRTFCSMIPCLMFAMLFFLPGASLAQEEMPRPSSSPLSPPMPLADGAFHQTLSFEDLQMEKDLDIGPNSADQTFQVGVSPDKLVRSATIHLVYRFRPGLFQTANNTLAVDWNGILLEKVSGSPRDSGQILSISIGVPGFLVNTRNTLRLRVIRDPKNPCAIFGSVPFITILRRSTVTVQGSRIGVPPRLSDLPFPFLYPDAAGLRRIPFVFASTHPEVLEAAGIAASWLGVNGPYLPFRFPVSILEKRDFSTLPYGHLILLALARDIPPGWFPAPISGPFLGILPHPTDPFSRILVISGQSPAEIRLAAIALSENRFPPEGGFENLPGAYPPPPRLPDDAPRWVTSRNTIPFGSLESPDALTVHGTGSVRVSFSLPPDLFTWSRKWIHARIRFRVRTKNRENRSRLDIFLNDRYQESLPLPAAADGSITQSADIPLAVGDLTPFRNRLVFNFNFRNSFPAVLSCTMDKNPRLSGTILPDSAIDIHAFPRFAVLPDLRLFPNGGYPFTRYADQERTGIVFSKVPGSGDIGIYLHMMSTFGAQTGLPAVRIRVSDPETLGRVEKRNLVIIGTYDSNPLLLKFTRSLPWESTANLEKLRREDLLLKIFRWKNPPPSHFGPSDLIHEFKKARIPVGVLMETASPYTSGRVVLSVVGVSQNGIRSMDRVLFDPRLFAGIFGNVTVVTPQGMNSFFLPASSFETGHLDWIPSVRFWFYSHPIGIVVCVILLVLGTGFLLRTLLGHIADKHSPDNDPPENTSA